MIALVACSGGPESTTESELQGLAERSCDALASARVGEVGSILAGVIEEVRDLGREPSALGRVMGEDCPEVMEAVAALGEVDRDPSEPFLAAAEGGPGPASTLPGASVSRGQASDTLEPDLVAFVFTPPVTFDQRGLGLAVTGISFQRLRQAGAPLDDGSTIVRLELTLVNRSGSAVSWHPDQGTLHIGSQVENGSLILGSAPVGGNDIPDGTVVSGEAVFAFGSGQEELVEAREARYVVGEALHPTPGPVLGEVDLVLRWEPGYKETGPDQDPRGDASPK